MMHGKYSAKAKHSEVYSLEEISVSVTMEIDSCNGALAICILSNTDMIFNVQTSISFKKLLLHYLIQPLNYCFVFSQFDPVMLINTFDLTKICSFRCNSVYRHWQINYCKCNVQIKPCCPRGHSLSQFPADLFPSDLIAVLHISEKHATSVKTFKQVKAVNLSQPTVQSTLHLKS